MNPTSIYLLTFLAVLTPFVVYVLFANNAPAPRGARKQEEEELPALFRFCLTPAKIMDVFGVGSLIHRLFPAPCRIMRKKLQYAGLNVSPEFIYQSRVFLTFMLGLLGAAGAWMVVEPDQQGAIPVAGLIGAFIGWFLPGTTVGNLVQTRQTQILQAIPFSIDLISSAMRGGLDFSAAIRFYVSLGAKGPLIDEYRIMLREMELGVIRTVALQNMAERIQLKEFTSFTSAVVMGTELGASLAETMEIQSEEMRKLRFSIAECKAQRAPSLMLLPMALFILPAVFIIILTPVFLKMKEAGVPLF
jgi:Flp pilus assembly protein TadB